MNKNDFISKLQGVIGQGDDFQVPSVCIVE